MNYRNRIAARTLATCLACLPVELLAQQPSSTGTPPTASRGRVAPPSPSSIASSGCQPSVTTLKQIAAAEWTTNPDADRVLREVDRAIGPDASRFAEPIGYSNGLVFAVSFPSRLYRWSLSEALRKREPIESAAEATGVLIEVSTTQIDAPNIEKVIVERNGEIVAPVTGRLTPSVKVTRLGARSVLNEGTFLYPCSAFLPGARVTITGIPSSGSNLSREFEEEELRSLTGHPPTKAGDLLGFRVKSAAAYLPNETSTENINQVGYLTKSGATLMVTHDDRRISRITAVSDGTVALVDLVVPTKVSNPPTIAAPDDAPRASTARCGDGTFAIRGGSCDGRSGVVENYQVPAPGNNPNEIRTFRL